MVVIGLLRAINVGRRQIRMGELRSWLEDLGLTAPQTLLQSGNVVFSTQRRDLESLAADIGALLERNSGFPCDVILRTPAELQRIVDSNPFRERAGIDPGKLVVHFLPGDLPQDACELFSSALPVPEEVCLSGRELYIHFPNGIAESGLARIPPGRILKRIGTARNWNTVTKLLALSKTFRP